MAEALRLQRIVQAGVDLLLAPDRFGGAGVNIGKALMVRGGGGMLILQPSPASPAVQRGSSRAIGVPMPFTQLHFPPLLST